MSLNDLPDELVLKIFKHASGHTSCASLLRRLRGPSIRRHGNLQACVQVSKRYNRIGTPLLYSTICYTTPSNHRHPDLDICKNLVDFLDLHKNHIDHIREIHIRGYGITTRESPHPTISTVRFCAIQAVIALLPSLKLLRLSKLEFTTLSCEDLSHDHTFPIPPRHATPTRPIDLLDLYDITFPSQTSLEPVQFLHFASLMAPRRIAMSRVFIARNQESGWSGSWPYPLDALYVSTDMEQLLGQLQQTDVGHDLYLRSHNRETTRMATTMVELNAPTLQKLGFVVNWKAEDIGTLAISPQARHLHMSIRLRLHCIRPQSMSKRHAYDCWTFNVSLEWEMEEQPLLYSASSSSVSQPSHHHVGGVQWRRVESAIL